ncbi:NADH-quinone oxidoreductase subunit C [Streptomyces sp. LZ34]
MTAPEDRNQPAEAERVGAVPVEAAAAPAQPTVGWLPRSATELFGEGATAEEAYGLLTVDVHADAWIPALETARDALGCTYFDWLSAVDEPGEGFRVAAHVVALGPAAAAAAGPGPAAAPAAPAVRGLLVRTTVAHEAPALPTATGVYAGAAWHERETHEMFGIDFADHPHLAPLLLPDGFEGHPLRKDFVLAARVVKAWPGAKEPGESEAAHAPRRRQILPPGVPDPNEWGPLKGQLPPAPARPARATHTAGAAGGTGAGAERPARRARSASAGSAGQRAATGAEAPTDESARPARRARSVSEGSASQRETGTDAAATGAPSPAARPRSTDAPWHHPRPARDEPKASGTPSSDAAPGAAAEADADAEAGERRGPSQTVAGEGKAGDSARREEPQGPAAPEDTDAPDAPDAPEAPTEPHTPHAPHTNTDDPAGGTA